MRDPYFEHVLIQSPRSGTVLNVTSVKQASELLENCWTKQCGPKHAVAVEMCANALKERVAVEGARLAFVEAAKEIGVYVAEKTRATAPPRSARNKVNDSAFSENGERPMPRRES
ncbi:hypothetical protein CU102_03755 [Phyllobacterium brassicacearum]|uniref:DUF982 domain-containing protein n=1 Tax=Phyllobacterium brassicacearum TaxID=314235 RepID=A0A2P7BUS0_9HYPH|nr:hypothetical protein CU102_03755 [Phyllobacterium brassicacearum]